MPALNEKTADLVASVVVDMKTAAKTILYTTPPGKIFTPLFLIVRDPTASLAGGTDYDTGTGANADTHKQTIDLSGMTSVGTSCRVIGLLDANYVECAAGSEFGVKVITGSTAAANATWDVLGILRDA